MKNIVLDVSVLAGYLLGASGRGENLSVLMRNGVEFIAPDIWRPELANTLWKYVQQKAITLDQGVELLQQSNALVSDTVSSASLWQGALQIAVQSNHPVYDCLYVALAMIRSTIIVTYDKRLLSTFSQITTHPDLVK